MPNALLEIENAPQFRQTEPMAGMGIGSGNGWLCKCGHTVPSHLLRCPRCQNSLSLDKVLTGVPDELPEPPIDEWLKEDGIRLVYSDESMKEVMAQGRKRKKRSKKINIKWSLLISLLLTTFLLVVSVIV